MDKALLGGAGRVGAQREGTGDAEESGGPHLSSCVGLVLQSVVSLKRQMAGFCARLWLYIYRSAQRHSTSAS